MCVKKIFCPCVGEDPAGGDRAAYERGRGEPRQRAEQGGRQAGHPDHRDKGQGGQDGDNGNQHR